MPLLPLVCQDVHQHHFSKSTAGKELFTSSSSCLCLRQASHSVNSVLPVAYSEWQEIKELKLKTEITYLWLSEYFILLWSTRSTHLCVVWIHVYSMFCKYFLLYDTKNIWTASLISVSFPQSVFRPSLTIWPWDACAAMKTTPVRLLTLIKYTTGK